MKKNTRIALAIIVLAGGAGAAWWKYGRNHDPMATAHAYLQKGDIRDAINALRTAVLTQPGNMQAHRQLGVLQLRTYEAVAAEKELKTARAMGATEIDLPVQLARSYMLQDRGKELLAEFQPPAATPELTSELLLLRAFAQAGQKDPEAAKASLAEAERLAPRAPNPRLAEARIAVGQHNLDLAEQKVTEALQRAPQRVDAMLLKAKILGAEGKTDEAIQALDAVLEIKPKNWVARLERANLLIVKGYDIKAQQDVQTVLDEQPNSLAATYLKAALLTRASDFISANLVFQRLSKVIARFPRSFYFQAITQYNLGKTEQAIESATRYAQHNQTDPDGVKLLARILLAAGRNRQTLTVLVDATQKGQADAEMLDLLGRAYAAAGEPEQAVETFNKAAAVAPGSADILTHLASARLNAGDPSGASVDFSRSTEMRPTRANSAEALVVAALSGGDLDKAGKALDDLRTLVGDTETVGLLTGTLLMKRQDYQGAQAQFDALTRQYPSAIRARLAFAQLLLLESKTDEAQRLLTDALHMEPTNEAVLGALLQIYMAQGHPAQAVALMQAALAAAPNSQPFLITLSDLYVRAGAPEKALALLDKAQRPDIEQPAPLLEARARAQMAQHQPAAAIETYRKVVTLVPGNTAAVHQLVTLQLGTKNWDGARHTLHEALLVHPGDADLLRTLVGVTLTEQGEDAALSEIWKMQADPVNRIGARTLVPDLDMFTHHFRQAAEGYVALLKDTRTAALALQASQAYQAASLPALARKLLEDWLATSPEDLEVASALAVLDIGNNQLDDARRLLEGVLQRQPSDVVALNNLAWVYGQQHDPRALETARRSFAIVPEPHSADTLGWILLARGDSERALPLLTQAANSMKDNPGAQYHYAAALKANGKLEQAAEVLRPIAVQARPFAEQPAAQKMLGELQTVK